MIVIHKRPYLQNFSGNPIYYELYDNDAVADATLSFQVKVLFMRGDGSIYEELTPLTLSPFEGSAKIDISPLLHILMEHFMPPVTDGTTTYNSGTASGRFYIHFRTISNTSTTVGWNTTEESFIRWAFKGGVHPFRFRGNAFFTQYVPTQKPFYTWQVRNRLAAINEKIYLHWINLLFGFLTAGTVKLKVLITYTDNTTATTEYSVPDSNLMGLRYYLPVGATDLNLASITPAKMLWRWEVWLEDVSVGGLGIISERFAYVLDNRKDYNDVQIHYRNSLGGLDTVRLRGVVVKNLDYQLVATQRSAAADFPDGDQLPAIMRTEPAIEQLRYRADIGYLGKEEQDRLRDAMLNREAYIIKWGRFFPINLVQSSFELTRSDAYKWAMPIEFTIADDGASFYTPDNADLGDADPSSNVCASFIVISGHTLFVDSPAAGLTTARINFAVSGGGTGLQWRVPGLVDEWQDIAFAASGYVDYAVASDVEFNFEMRVKCSADNYGAFTSHFVDTDPAPPAANSTIYNETDTTSTFTVKVNGVAVAIGVVPAASYSPFFMPATSGDTVTVELGSISPSEVDLFIIDTIYAGVVVGNISTWTDVYSTLAGVTITIR